MNEITKSGNDFVGYEYKEMCAQSDKVSMYFDGYISFGWVPDENITPIKSSKQTVIKLKRDRKILNKVELTRLQRHFEACMDEINAVEKSKASVARMVAIIVAIAGTVFIALSTFAVTSKPPLIVACILFAIPGFIGWVSSYFVYKRVLTRRTAKLTPLIEQKYDEIYEICKKGNHLLSR